MDEPSHDRNSFETYAKRLFEEVHTHKDEANIEIETVFPRWTPNIAISVSNKGNEKTVYCGQPTVEKLDGGNYLLVPSVKCALTDGIEVFGMVELKNLGESVQYTAIKAYVALVNDKAGDVYHLFPSLSPLYRRSFVEELSKVYANLAKTTDELVPNYILKSIRSTGANPQTAAPSAFRNVINQLVQKACDKEKWLVKSQLHAHTFGAEEFECIYKRFKYLSEQPHSGVKMLHKSRTVDISVQRTHGKATNNTRISLHGQDCFDAYCSLFKKLKSANDIVSFVQHLPKDKCEVIQKREMKEDELKILAESPCYNGFKFNVKREDTVRQREVKQILESFFDADMNHTYRYKRRYSFDCGGFNVDLTMVLKGDDSHPVFNPTPFVALEKMRKELDQYEFEIECSASQADSATQCLHWMDECLCAMRRDTYFFGNHRDKVFYPLFMDPTQTRHIVQRFNSMVCHGDNKVKHSANSVNNNIGPNVVNITHATYNYICHHFNDYAILMKTDGLRCIGYVDSQNRLMHLFVQNATYPMTVRLQNTPTADYVVDGELYTQNQKSSYFVFDVYQKGEQHLLTKTLTERLDSLTDELVVESSILVVKKKAALYLTKYQELYNNTTTDSDHLRQLKDAFECVDCSGMKANDDGFILMHTGPLVRDISADDEEVLVRIHGTKPYIMRLQEFKQGTHSISSMSRMQQGAYAFCLKWKPEEECTIDFKVNLLVEESTASANQKRALLCSKYKTDSELNMYTIVQALGAAKVSTTLCPHATPNKVHTFQPAEAYDYELREPLSSGVSLATDAASGKVFTEKKELVRNNDIVEMRYNKETGMWTPVRLRTDKTEPNVYSVALANWKNIFHPVSRPLDWKMLETPYDASDLVAYYAMRKQNYAISQLDSIHLLLKQHLILFTSRVWSTHVSRGKMKVFEVGCGKGTDLFHWDYVHKNVRTISFYFGTDNDKSGLMRHDGAYYRYLQGNRHNRLNTRKQTLDGKYAFDALFVQADASVSFQQCRERSWDGQRQRGVSKHKLDYELLRYVLYGKTPEDVALGNVFHGGMVHPTYNLVSCQFALHHFADDKQAFWNNLNMLLSVDGLFIATVPNGDFISAQLHKSTDGEYTVPIRDAKNPNSIVQWYKYESSRNKNKVFFQTPKISRSEEPLLRKDQLLRTIRKHFDVVYMDTFAQYVSKQQLDIYKTSCDSKGVFHAASIDGDTLAHTFTGKHSHLANNVRETPEALRYSQQGHYVVVLCKKNGRSEAELDALREHFS